MKPQTIGRALGIGMRVAGRMAGERLAGNAQAAAARPVTIEGVTDPARARATGKTAGRATSSLARGVGGFLRPFGRVGSKIFLEVAGLFSLSLCWCSGRRYGAPAPATCTDPIMRSFWWRPR